MRGSILFPSQLRKVLKSLLMVFKSIFLRLIHSVELKTEEHASNGNLPITLKLAEKPRAQQSLSTSADSKVCQYFVSTFMVVPSVSEALVVFRAFQIFFTEQITGVHSSYRKAGKFIPCESTCFTSNGTSTCRL